VRLPGQTRVTPEEYKEFLCLGHGDVFHLDIDRSASHALLHSLWRSERAEWLHLKGLGVRTTPLHYERSNCIPYWPAFPQLFRFLLRTGRIFVPQPVASFCRADSHDHIQMLSEIIVESLRIGSCGQVKKITFRRSTLPAGRRRASTVCVPICQARK